jgi:hypothetical protein
MAGCDNLKRNSGICNCTYAGCPRHGICCECLGYHRSNGELPACYFDSEREKSYDRSVNNYLRGR